MISQRCPKCFSNRIRRGYRPTPLWSKFLFRYNLLCDSCNWEFTGFAVPGTVSSKPAKRHRKQRSVREVELVTESNAVKIALSDNAVSEPETPGKLDAEETIPKEVKFKKARARNK